MLGKLIENEEKDMTLSEIAEKVGVPIVDLSPQKILEAVKNKIICMDEVKDVLSELEVETADIIWTKGDGSVAESLWPG